MAKGTTLVAPNGQRTTVSTPAAVINLVYGSGYRYLKDVQAEEQVARERQEAETQQSEPKASSSDKTDKR